MVLPHALDIVAFKLKLDLASEDCYWWLEMPQGA
jgi:hypothetical protein